jgi:FAD/FMN-containing dehydrogenase
VISVSELLEVLRPIGDVLILQEAPYPVIAPTTVEAVADCVRVAREQHVGVLTLGSGSSFPPDFHVLRENLLALMTIRLTGIQTVNPFTTRILAGTPVAAVVHGANEYARKTVGGLLADAHDRMADPAIRALWSRVNAVEVISPQGEIRRCLTAQAGGRDDPGIAELLLGSRGRLGVITAVEIAGLVPLELTDGAAERHPRLTGERSEPPLTLREIQVHLDPDGVFQWS